MIRSHTARLAGALTACLGLLLLAACEDPSGAGLSVVDFGETDPRTRTLVAEAAMDTLADESGFIHVPGTAFTQRMIAGRAEDPLYGTIEATGYIHLQRPLDIPGDFFFTPIDAIFLDLVPNYLYGDTTQTAVIDLYEVSESWQPLQFTSDTTLPVFEEVVTSFSVSASDTMVRVLMPQDWIERRDSLLRAEGFEQQFHGFQLRPQPQSGLAVGFEGTSTMGVVLDFEITPEADTVRLASSALATGVTRDLSTGMMPAELFPLQDNVGAALSLQFDPDEIGSPAVSAGFVRIEADTLLLEANRPVHFVRPLARSLWLSGMSNGIPVFLADALLNEEQEAYIFSSRGLNQVFRDMALGRSPFDTLVVSFPRSPSTLNVAPLVSDPDAPPRAVVLVSPADL